MFLGLVMSAVFVMVSGLAVMVGSGFVTGRGGVMVIAGRMLGGHYFLPIKWPPRAGYKSSARGGG